MQKLLLLGAKGNLGTEIQKKSIGEFQLTAWDKEDVDITDKTALTDKIRRLQPNIIINTAAYNLVDECEKNLNAFQLALKINQKAPGWLGEVALSIDAVLVHYSSDYVFAGDRKEGYKEDDKTEPVNKYGKTKLLGERELENLKKQGLKYYLIRTSKLFGSPGSSKFSKAGFFDIMLKLANTKKEIKVVDEELSCFTYTSDLAQATMELVTADMATGKYHIINSGPVTWYEAVTEMFKIAKIKIKVIPVSSDEFPRPAKRPQYSVLLNTKLKPMRDYKEALEEYLAP